MNSPWTLRVTDADSDPLEIPATPGLSIGRHPDCDLILTDSRVSARHAKIVASGAELAIVDLGSNNGTCIDGARILKKDQEQVLGAGMRIRLGRAEIEVLGPPATFETTLAGSDAAEELSPQNATTKWSDDAQPTKMAFDSDPSRAAAPDAPSVPAARVSPPPPPAPAPAVGAHDASDSLFDSVELNTIIANADHLLGAQSKLSRMGGRLVVLNEADLRVVPVDDVEFTIGRAPESSLHVQNRGVSQAHARIVFVASSHLFMVEDLASANGTQVAGAPLIPNTPRELGPDTLVRFGTIEAVFMQDLDTNFHDVPARDHENAAKLLQALGKVSAGVLKQAAVDAPKHQQTVGEALLLGQHVSARDWCVAVNDARLASTLADLSGGRSKRSWIILLIFVLVALGLLFALPQGRELLGMSS